MVTAVNEAKNTVAPINEPKTLLIWNQATMTWDEATFSWDQSTPLPVNESKNTTVPVNESQS